MVVVSAGLSACRQAPPELPQVEWDLTEDHRVQRVGWTPSDQPTEGDVRLVGPCRLTVRLPEDRVITLPAEEVRGGRKGDEVTALLIVGFKTSLDEALRAAHHAVSVLGYDTQPVDNWSQAHQAGQPLGRELRYYFFTGPYNCRVDIMPSFDEYRPWRLYFKLFLKKPPLPGTAGDSAGEPEEKAPPEPGDE